MAEAKRKKTNKQRSAKPRPKKKRTQSPSQVTHKKTVKKRPNTQKEFAKKRKKRRKAPIRKKKRSNPIMSGLFSFLFYGFVLCIVVGSTLFAASKNSDKSIFGYQFFGVLTDSMVAREKGQKGGFHAGDMIIIKNISGESAEVDDIITFRPSIDSQAFLTHRVKKKLDHLGENQGTYYITQGDANLTEDVPIHSKQVVGKKVAVIPKVSGVLTFVRDHILISVVFCVSVFGFITVVRYYVLNK